MSRMGNIRQIGQKQAKLGKMDKNRQIKQNKAFKKAAKNIECRIKKREETIYRKHLQNS